MKTLKRIRYYTMNSWNLSKAPAYNLKIYNVIDADLRDKVWKMLECEDFYFDINIFISDFAREYNYAWQAAFNGRSGGYLVLYKGGCRKSGYKSYCVECGQRNFTSIKETSTKCGKCGKEGRVDRDFKDIYTQPGKQIENEEVPCDVKKAFRKLAIDIVKDTEYKARNCKVENEEYQVIKTRKVLV